MKKLVAILWGLFFILNIILGIMAGNGDIDVSLFFRVLIGTNLLCLLLWGAGKLFSADSNY